MKKIDMVRWEELKDGSKVEMKLAKEINFKWETSLTY